MSLERSHSCRRRGMTARISQRGSCCFLARTSRNITRNEGVKSLILLGGGPGRTRTSNQTVMSGGPIFVHHVLSAFLSKSMLSEALQNDPIWGETGAVAIAKSAFTKPSRGGLVRKPTCVSLYVDHWNGAAEL